MEEAAKEYFGAELTPRMARTENSRRSRKIRERSEEELPEEVVQFLNRIAVRPSNVTTYNLLQTGIENLHEVYLNVSGDVEVPVKDLRTFDIEKVAKYGNKFYVSFWAPEL